MPRTDTKGTSLRVDAALLAGKGLEDGGDRAAKKKGNPRRILSQRDPRQQIAIVFEGDIVVAIYESGPAKVEIVDCFYDEFVHVVEGQMILTDDKGVAQEYNKGDNFVMPKGFCGTWEMTSDVFRELVAIETKSLEADHNAE